MELPSGIHQIPVEHSDVISLLAMCDVCLPRKPVYLFLGVLLCEYVALHLLVMHDEISRQIAIFNEEFKFVAYSHNILQEFVLKMK